MKEIYDMAQSLAMSWGRACGEQAEVLLRVIPNASQVRRASERDDREGTDYWVMLGSGHELSVDVKVRQHDPMDKWGTDDLLLEWESDKERRRPGWTVDPMKRTDYVLYWFESSSRYCLLPFALFYAAAVSHRDEWQAIYGVRQSYSSSGRREWTTTWSAVPRKVVWHAMVMIGNGYADKMA